MNKLLHTLALLLWLAPTVWATHNRAGEITYRQLSEFTYEITVVTYTYTKSDADRDSLELAWGDNTLSWIRRVGQTLLPDDFKRNVYVAVHTYPGPGSYEMFMLDQNRNAGIGNIDGSVNIPFSIKTTLRINPQIGFNNTPILLTEPLDRAAVGRLFVHNPAAFDIDGDSISYKLTTCLGDNGEPIPHYRFPESSNRPIYIDAVTGDLVWDTPTKTGNYNVAFYIEEWRNGIKIGQVLRDMQITVVESENMPPQIDDFARICIEAGQRVAFDVLATDANTDDITLSAYGGPFRLKDSPASFTVALEQPGRSIGRFEWQTLCSHVRKAEYQVEFKAEDRGWDVRLVDFATATIQVVAPAPIITDLQPTNNTIRVLWQPVQCSSGSLLGYKLYRRIGSSDYKPQNCVTGLPPGTGFELVATFDDPSQDNYLDTDNGQGLKQGQWYCYRLVSVFADGAESYPSEERCQRLVRGIPIITNVDVQTTSASTGSIDVAWVKPTEHDPLRYPGPYSYKVFRALGTWGSDFVQVAQLQGIDNTSFRDTELNTRDTAFNYKVEFYSNNELVSPPQTASSIFIRLRPVNAMRLSIERNVPWIDTAYVVFRQAPGQADYLPIDTTRSLSYDDTQVQFDQEYCYYVRGLGYFSVEDVKSPVINHSQQACAKYLDTTPPCPPTAVVESNCDADYNQIDWQLTDQACNDDVSGFEIWYSPTLDGDMQRIQRIDDPAARSWLHYPNGPLAGCYQVRAYDFFDNLSPASATTCIDKCSKYTLPNIFTPDGDQVNDRFRPIAPYYGVEKVDFVVFNRWGKQVFATNNPELDWDGTDQTTGQRLANGVYFFTCTVYEPRITGLEDRHITGFIQIAAQTDIQND